VILGLADRRRLLRVDRIGRRREVVVRSLGELLSNVPGVSGCTELGDGRTILILDVLALFETGTTPAGTWPAPVLP
jgi:chemotaxis protein histidine kinase CheA